jgi:hypothetical protein
MLVKEEIVNELRRWSELLFVVCFLAGLAIAVLLSLPNNPWIKVAVLLLDLLAGFGAWVAITAVFCWLFPPKSYK